MQLVLNSCAARACKYGAAPCEHAGNTWVDAYVAHEQHTRSSWSMHMSRLAVTSSRDAACEDASTHKGDRSRVREHTREGRRERDVHYTRQCGCGRAMCICDLRSHHARETASYLVFVFAMKGCGSKSIPDRFSGGKLPCAKAIGTRFVRSVLQFVRFRQSACRQAARLLHASTELAF